MAFQPSYKSRVLLGSLNLSCQIRNMTLDESIDMVDVSTICDQAKQFIPGQPDGTFSADGPLDVATSTAAPFPTLTAWKATSALPLTYAPRGLTTGTEVMLGDALASSFQSTNTPTGSADFSISAQLTDGIDPGVSVEDLTAVTIDTTGVARDLTAASTNGGVAHLHVSAFSGLTSDVITIEQSANGSTSWTTLVTFATVTGATSQRVVVAPGTSVARYLRVVDDVTGTGSITRAVAFARR
jgi:hypothetical protein